MMKLLVATSNAGKLRELRALLVGLDIEIVTVRELGIDPEVEEDQDTFEGNARKKATTLARRSGLSALADDSGLEVDALGGAPGVYSARFAGVGASDDANVSKLLAALGESAERGARFRCVVALATETGEIAFVGDGACEGVITHERRGEGGFGYDPVFVPSGEVRTMAQLEPEEKNGISHRSVAMAKLRGFLAGIRASQQ